MQASDIIRDSVRMIQAALREGRFTRRDLEAVLKITNALRDSTERLLERAKADERTDL